jgi:hypothetical protein
MKHKYLGWEFRDAIAAACHKICADLSLDPVTVGWKGGITTAAINSHGNIFLSYVRDDAVMTRAHLMQYTGFVVHELLHRKYTDFSARHGNEYIDQLTNALEDARIEHLAIDNQLTGNVTALLETLIGKMVGDALSEVTDWSEPRQYPFVLAVYARKHATTKIPLAYGLAPIFDEAVSRLANSKTTVEVVNIAIWVYEKLQRLPQPKGAPKPPKASTSPSNEPGEGDGEGEGDRPSKEAGQPGKSSQPGSPGKATAPRGSLASNVEPQIDAGKEAGSGGFYFDGSTVAKPLRHVSPDNRRFPISF